MIKDRLSNDAELASKYHTSFFLFYRGVEQDFLTVIICRSKKCMSSLNGYLSDGERSRRKPLLLVSNGVTRDDVAKVANCRPLH